MMTDLSPRLKMVAGMTRENKALCDVGTDHAYLPVYLLQRRMIPYAFAGDINKGPLENAGHTVEKYGLSEKVELILGSGLMNFKENCAADFVIAGMGGELIAKILSDTAWVERDGNHFVLQPQSHAEDLREYLTIHGFEILKEDVCRDGKHLYLAMEVVFTGKSSNELIPQGVFPDAYYYTGKLPYSDSTYKNEYLMQIKSRLSVRVDALTKASKDDQTVKRLCRVTEYIDGLLDDSSCRPHG